MSLRRFQRGVRQMGGFAGGTSRLARPPTVLPEPDVRPSGGPGTVLACILNDSASAISTPTGWTLADEWTGPGVWIGIWRLPLASGPDDLTVFPSAIAAGTPTNIVYDEGTLTFTGSGGFATVVEIPGDPSNTLSIHDDTLTVSSGVTGYDPLDFDVSVAVVFGADNVDTIGDFTLFDYGGPTGLEIGVWRHEGVSSHEGAWDSTNGVWAAAVFFAFGYPT